MAQKENSMSPERRKELENLAQQLGYRFKNLELLNQALRHSSYVYENPKHGASNERLEFLGDAVLDLTVCTLLLARFPKNSEGDLSRGRASLVNAKRLANLARNLNLGPYLLLGRTEERQEGRLKPSLLANALEAVLAAVYLDGGLAAAARLTEHWFNPFVTTALPPDYKTSLQELSQARYKALPSYHLVHESGPDHAKLFRVEVRIKDTPLAQGEGSTKKQAAQRAARVALEKLETEVSKAEEGGAAG